MKNWINVSDFTSRENPQLILESIKYAEDSEAFQNLLNRKKEQFSKVERQTAALLAEVTRVPIDIDQEEGEKINMCKAFDEMLQDKMEQGIEQGMERGIELKLITLIRKKRAKGVSPEDCAEMLEEDVLYVRDVYNLMEQNPDADDGEICRMLGSIEVSNLSNE